MKYTATKTSPASDAQMRFYDSLVSELGVPTDPENVARQVASREQAAADKSYCSRQIDALKTAVDAKRREARTTQAATVRTVAQGITEDGMYRLPDGTVYKVQRAVHGSGNLYAKVLVIDAEAKSGSFEYAPGAIKTLRPEHKMTLEQAKEFGALYGFCVKCGATLTDEKSIAAGIGPICGSKGF